MANVTAFCNECSATRTAKAQAVPRRDPRNLHCVNCQRSTPHVRLHPAGSYDYGERRNAEHPVRLIA